MFDTRFLLIQIHYIWNTVNINTLYIWRQDNLGIKNWEPDRFTGSDFFRPLCFFLNCLYIWLHLDDRPVLVQWYTLHAKRENLHQHINITHWLKKFAKNNIKKFQVILGILVSKRLVTQISIFNYFWKWLLQNWLLRLLLLGGRILMSY